MFERLRALEERLGVLDRMLMDPSVTSDGRRLAEVATEHAHVGEVVGKYRELKSLETELAGARELLGEDDPDLRDMARAEVDELTERIDTATQQLKIALLPKDPFDGRPLLLEIRAGTGGDEAALFAADLFRMYSRFAERHSLKVEVLSSSAIAAAGTSSTQGFKEIIASVSGKDAYAWLKFESGVHRVQRIPATESQGRIHTSAATVAVLPEPEEVELRIDAKDLRIDTMRAGGPGGQSVNTTDSAVRIVHIPTGLIVQCQDEKSQLKNKEKAMRVLKTRLYEREVAARHAEEAAARKAQVGSGDRSERIRTYNYPQNRITDHRINLTLYQLDKVVAGECEAVIEPLIAHHQAELLAGLEGG